MDLSAKPQSLFTTHFSSTNLSPHQICSFSDALNSEIEIAIILVINGKPQPDLYVFLPFVQHTHVVAKIQ
jgi:hypothetical protein